MKIILSLLIFFLLSACNQTTSNDPKQITQEELREFFSKNRVGRSPDYAIVKNGDDYLLTIHSYWDDYEACMEIIQPYNKNPELSVMKGNYSCVKLN